MKKSLYMCKWILMAEKCFAPRARNTDLKWSVISPAGLSLGRFFMTMVRWWQFFCCKADYNGIPQCTHMKWVTWSELKYYWIITFIYVSLTDTRTHSSLKYSYATKHLGYNCYFYWNWSAIWIFKLPLGNCRLPCIGTTQPQPRPVMSHLKSRDATADWWCEGCIATE